MGTGAKILVVDDELESLKLIGLMLQRRGYEISAARSGQQALEKAVTDNPDLVILDVMMPDMDGFEVCRRLRADPATADLPIIIFTAKTMVDDKVTGFQAGADDYLTKPVHPEELASRIEAVLLRTSGRRAEEKAPMKAKLIGFIGAKGGAGTTTLAINIAAALADGPAREKRIILAEMQDGMTTAGLQLGLRHPGTMVNLLQHSVEEIDARLVEAQLEEHRSGVWVLSGSSDPPGIAPVVTSRYAERIIHHLGAMADYLLIDLGVGLSEKNRFILSKCDRVVVATEPQRVALVLAGALLEAMDTTLGIPRHRISIVPVNKAPSAFTMTKDAIEGLLQHDVAGVVTPAPEMAFQSAERGIPMVMAQPMSLVAQQIRAIMEKTIQF